MTAEEAETGYPACSVCGESDPDLEHGVCPDCRESWDGNNANAELNLLRAENKRLRDTLGEVTMVAAAHVAIDTMDGHEEMGGLAAEVLAHKRAAVARAIELLKGIA